MITVITVTKINMVWQLVGYSS